MQKVIDEYAGGIESEADTPDAIIEEALSSVESERTGPVTDQQGGLQRRGHQLLSSFGWIDGRELLNDLIFDGGFVCQTHSKAVQSLGGRFR